MMTAVPNESTTNSALNTASDGTMLLKLATARLLGELDPVWRDTPASWHRGRVADVVAAV